MRLLFLTALAVTACAPASIAEGEPDEPCTESDREVVCKPRIAKVMVNGVARDVFWREGLGEMPAGGRPVVVVFQGSFFGPPSTWNSVSRDLAFGGFFQAQTQKRLLEHGFTVVAPAAVAGVAWQTNATIPWDTTTDKVLVDNLLTALDDGTFGTIDASRRYATGISSGGYMTSRMALSYAGKFRALAIHAGSWATCIGPACVLPESLPADHPPTLFLHGEKDPTVPLFTVQPYVQKLKDQGTTTELIIDGLVGHQWISEAPERTTAWFEEH
ncbi:MAG: hypothetical protein JNM17_09105 [Archangium sp.]|nr:hypothetical protein [Archangium sp.]